VGGGGGGGGGGVVSYNFVDITKVIVQNMMKGSKYQILK